jgi:hypothetical protein
MQHFCQMLEALQRHHLGEIAFMGGFVQMHMFRTSRSTE